MENLEEKVEKKQWFPILGMVYMTKATIDKRPSLADINYPGRRAVSMAWHMGWTIAAVYGADFLYTWADKNIF